MNRVDRRTFLKTAARSGVALLGATEVGCGAARAVQPAPRLRRLRTLAAPRVPRTIQQAIRGHVFGMHTPGYSGAARIYNTRFDGIRPKWVARPIDTADVSRAIRWAVEHDVPLRARSGGHSYAGYSTLDGGLVLDLRRLNRISIDRRAGTASIGAGAQLINVYAGLATHGAMIPAGSCPSVGVGGHALGGGMGLAGRAFGLALDNLIGLEIVTADGQVRNVSERSDPDLFWALRGAGGGNFGVVTQFRFRVRPLPRVASWVSMSWPWSEASAALAAWQSWQPHATEKFSSVFHLETGPAVSLSGQYLGPADDLPGLLAPLRDVPGASLNFGQEDYFSLQMLWAGCAHQPFNSCHTVGMYPGGRLARANFRAGSDYVNRALSGAGRAALVDAVEQRGHLPGSGAALLDSYGGAINRVPPNATSFVHRDALFCIQYLSYDDGGAWVGQARSRMRPYVSGYCYQNYIDPTLRDWQHAYYGSNYPRLRAVRRQVDPEHRFRFPQGID